MYGFDYDDLSPPTKNYYIYYNFTAHLQKFWEFVLVTV